MRLEPRRTSLRGLAALGFGLATAQPAGAQTPVGAEFQVNSYTANDQAGPAIAVRSAGDFVVVWESRGSSLGDTSSWSVQGQRYASGGLPQGPQFQVNSYIAYGQLDASVVVTSPSQFVVTWHGYGSGGNDTGISSSIHGQRFSLPPAVPALTPMAAAACALLLALAAGIPRVRG